MGLFGKLFRKKEQHYNSEQTSKGTSHKQEWDFYFSNVDDIIGSFYIDLGLTNIAPVPSKPNLVWISVQMNSPREDGLSSNEEFESLNAIEDKLHESIVANHNAIYAGRLTTDGRRDFYFYMGDTTFLEQTISESMVAFPAYSIALGIKEDKEWRQYFNFMYPSPKQYQSIQNRRVIEQLEKSGDPLTKARQVDHWLYFKTETDRTMFLNKIEHLNFRVITKNEAAYGEHPYELHISRVDHVDNNSVDDYTLHLWELAQECNGEYDGWETSVEE